MPGSDVVVHGGSTLLMLAPISIPGTFTIRTNPNTDVELSTDGTYTAAGFDFKGVGGSVRINGKNVIDASSAGLPIDFGGTPITVTNDDLDSLRLIQSASGSVVLDQVGVDETGELNSLIVGGGTLTFLNDVFANTQIYDDTSIDSISNVAVIGVILGANRNYLFDAVGGAGDLRLPKGIAIEANSAGNSLELQGANGDVITVGPLGNITPFGMITIQTGINGKIELQEARSQSSQTYTGGQIELAGDISVVGLAGIADTIAFQGDVVLLADVTESGGAECRERV